MDISDKLFKLIKDNKFIELEKEIKTNKKVNLNTRDESGNYLISYAIIKNNLSMIKLLLNEKCKIDIVDQEGRTILYSPIKYGYDDIISLLLEYNDQTVGVSIVDMKDKFNNISLHYAIYFSNLFALDILLSNRSNTNILDSDGYNSLHLAIHSKNIDMCKKIIDHGVNINARTKLGETALHIAVNLQIDPMVRLLIDKGIDVNLQDYESELTALMYAISSSNSNIAKYLLFNGANPNIQDYNGNTAIHYSIIYESNEILYNILKYDDKSIVPNLNLYNINGQLPLHIALYKKTAGHGESIDKLIMLTNLNFQDTKGNTAFHLMCRDKFKKNIWLMNQKILEKKKLNVFILNNKKKRPIDFISPDNIKSFLNMVTNSYLYILRNYNFIWKNDWENLCTKAFDINKLTNSEVAIIKKYIELPLVKSDIQDAKTSSPGMNNDICYNIIYNKINDMYKKKDSNIDCISTSYPIKQSKKCIQFDIGGKIDICTFSGITLDILMGLIYLLDKHPGTCAPISSNFITNDQLQKYYKDLGMNINTNIEFMNFEVIWAYKKLFVSSDFIENYKKCIDNINIRFVIVPIGIEIDDGSHANYLILDKNTFELERYEPYGAESPFKYNYNSSLLDNILSFKFNDINPNIKYISPKKYLSKMSFQYFDVNESKTVHIGDAGGFCGLWSIWYTDMRLMYPDISRDKLVRKLFKMIKQQNISFKNMIRNYSINITKIRDVVFKKANITINDWINEQYTPDQHRVVLQEIGKLVQSHI